MKKLLAPKLVQLLDLVHAINSLKLLVSMHTSFFSFRKFSFNTKDILSEVNSVIGICMIKSTPEYFSLALCTKKQHLMVPTWYRPSRREGMLHKDPSVGDNSYSKFTINFMLYIFKVNCKFFSVCTKWAPSDVVVFLCTKQD